MTDNNVERSTRHGKNAEKDMHLFIGLAIVVLFFAASGYISYMQVQAVRDHARWVTHTYDVIGTTDKILSYTIDAETGERGYIITGKEDYLEPYNAALPLINTQIDKLDKLTSDDPVQQERVHSLRGVVTQTTEKLADIIKIRRDKGFADANAAVLTGWGKRNMDDIRDRISEIQKTEQGLLETRRKETTQAYRVAIIVAIISALMGIFLAITIAWVLRRAAVARRREKWFQVGRGGLATAIMGDLTLEQLGDKVLGFLADYLGAHAGIFFAKDDRQYKRTATYGFSSSAASLQAVNENDNLLGQAIKDMRSFILCDVPDNYLKIGSGLGEVKPRHVAITPAVADEGVHAVFELGFISEPNEDTVTFLEQVSNTIAIAVQSVNYKHHLQKLLEETQAQAEELQSSEEELKTQQEELEAANEEMEQRAEELETLNKQIKESGEQLSAVVDSSLDGMITINEQGIVQSVNPACERLFGYTADEVIGHNVKMLMPEPYHSEHDGYLHRYNKTGDAHIIGTAGREVTGKRKDDSTFPMDLSVSSFKLGGQRFFSGTVRDISERKEAEDRMLKYQQDLENSSRYKSEFLANMSHELRTPLNSLLILARGLADNEEGNLTEEQIEEAGVIHNSGLELLTLINDILDLSKVEAGKLSIIAEDTPLDGMIKHMKQQFEPVSGESGVNFDVQLEAGLPVTMYTDAQRAEQILKNLLSNAFKFTEKGTVTLKIFRPGPDVVLQQPSLEHGNTIAFAVSDTGIGIDQGKLNDIFEAFQQEDGSTDRHYGGTGLGLTIARKFAYMLGGELHAASKKGEGSTFTLMLPEKMANSKPEDQSGTGEQEKEPVVPARTPVNDESRDGAGLKTIPKSPLVPFIADDRDSIGDKDQTLLIIEDDKDFAKILMKTAKKRGYKCVVAGDGKTGILLAAEYPVSAVVLDLILPDIDGMTVLDQLKHDLRTRHIPVHIITGRDESDSVVPLRKGAIGCLTKPLQEEDINGVFTKIEDFLQSAVKKILIVEDDKKSQTAIQRLLKKKDVEMVCVGSGDAALKKIGKERFDCIILDLLLPDMTGFEWLDKVEQQTAGGDFLPVIIYTGKELSEEENRKLSCYTGSVVIKGAHSSERLLDEVTLFLHSVEATLSKSQQEMIRMQHNPDRVLEEKTILLVDDDLRNTFALSKVLKKRGMNVVIADNGQMALEKLREENGIALVIMDIMMPIMDGYEAMRAIRKESKWQDLPVIALTARAMPEEQEKCLEAGANDYMTKPVDAEHLLTLMRVWLFRQEDAA